MAFAQTLIAYDTTSALKREIYKCVGTGVTTGELSHGLSTVSNVLITAHGSAVHTGVPTFDEVLPLASNTAVTLVFDSGVTTYVTLEGN